MRATECLPCWPAYNQYGWTSLLKPQATTSQYSLAAPPLKATCVKCKQSYLLHHLGRERERLLSSWARRVDPLQDGDRPPTHHLCCQDAQQTLRHCCHRQQGGSQSTAAAPGYEWRPQSPLSGKKPEAKLQDAQRLRRKPQRSRRPRKHKQGGNY